MIFNHNQPPFAGDAGNLVIQAVNLALNRDSIIKDAMGGRGKPFLGVIPTTVPSSFEYPKLFAFDTAKAKALLAQAGYPGGSGLPSSGLQLYYPSESASTLQPIAIAIKANLADIGMNVSLNPIPQAQFQTRQFTKRDMPMSLQTAGVGLYDALIYLKTWYVSTSAGGLIGPGNYKNAAVDQLWQTGANSPKASVQRSSAQGAQDILAKTLSIVPIARLPLDAAIRSNITGVNISGPGLMFLGHVTKK
jgi:ABC-type transport system substrate-binding protein